MIGTLLLICLSSSLWLPKTLPLSQIRSRFFIINLNHIEDNGNGLKPKKVSFKGCNFSVLRLCFQTTRFHVDPFSTNEERRRYFPDGSIAPLKSRYTKNSKIQLVHDTEASQRVSFFTEPCKVVSALLYIYPL